MYGRWHKTSSDFLPPSAQENEVLKAGGLIVDLKIFESKESLTPSPVSPHLVDLKIKGNKNPPRDLKNIPNLLDLREHPPKQKFNIFYQNTGETFKKPRRWRLFGNKPKPKHFAFLKPTLAPKEKQKTLEQKVLSPQSIPNDLRPQPSFSEPKKGSQEIESAFEITPNKAVGDKPPYHPDLGFPAQQISSPQLLPLHPMISPQDLNPHQQARENYLPDQFSPPRPHYPFAPASLPKIKIKTQKLANFKNALQAKMASASVIAQKTKRIIFTPSSFNPLALFSYNRSLAIFVIICLFFSSTISLTAFTQRVFFLKKDILSRANIAYAHLNEAQSFLSNQDYDSASSAFAQASSNFQQSLHDTQQMGKVITQILDVMPLASKVAQGPRILKAGEYLATAGEYLALTIKPFQEMDPIYAEAQASPSVNKLTLTKAIAASHDNLEIALRNLRKAEEELNEINSQKLEPDIRDKVEFLQKTMPVVSQSLNTIFTYSDDFLKILGHDRSRRYLLLFQNNNEIRATGGFIGTYGILELDEGRIKNLEIDGIYNPDGQVLDRISPPDPIRFTNTRWHGRDANWFPNFPTSAQKVAWFIEKGGKPSVDGVIALTPNLIIDLLKLTDPIDMPEYDTTINPDNFVNQTQREVELEYNRAENNPKKFLADLAPILLQRILNSENPDWLEILAIFSRNLAQKHLLFYFNDQTLQDFVINQGWGGEVKDASQDYLMLVNSNINGGKTDSMIQEVINLVTTIQEDGSLLNEVTVTRTHTGNFEWPSINNIDYVRLYVPKGSTLLSASGFDKVNIPPLTYEEEQYTKDSTLEEIRKTSKIDENSQTVITEEFNKTCFGNWVAVRPQDSTTYSFKYKLPFQLKLGNLNTSEKYSLLIQKQSGSLGSQINHEINLPAAWQVVWKYPEDAILHSEQSLSWSGQLITDQYFGLALEKK